ncbi:vanadium-dependent haloperoxidase [Sphingomonas sp. SAFR-052]|uniref:vanadium-dependent haloperoxidase n=1 Tax=Sphingomonas sp. SAFR-052 TaxID=3436867 RepID=UPI003F802608
MATAALQCAYAGNGLGALYKVTGTGPFAGGDKALRAAAACHQLLARRYPNQARILYPLWETWLDLFRNGASGPEEVEGRGIGDLINGLTNPATRNGMSVELNDREIAKAERPYEPKAPYDHNRPFNSPNQMFAGDGWGDAKPLKATRVAPFAPPAGRTGPAPGDFDGNHSQYQQEVALVAEKGGFQRGTRTGQEEVTGVFWGYDGPPEIGTPPRLYMQVALAILDQLHAKNPVLNTDEELLAIAGVGIAMADAGIDAWHYKYSPDHMLWRPALGIPHAGRLGWLPYGRPDTNGTGVALTPDFPAYPSGHATFGAAAFHLLRLFLVQQGAAQFNADGTDTLRFTFASDEYNGRNVCPQSGLPRSLIARTYDSLWAAIIDNSISRVFLGVHWQFDGVTIASSSGGDTDGEFGVPHSPQDLGKRGGVWLGVQIANQIAPSLGVTAATIDASRS